MNLSRRLERIETARPGPLTAEDFLDLQFAGRIPESRFDIAVRRLSDDELQRSIDILGAMIDGAKGSK